MVQEIKLEKLRAGTRLTSFGESADSIYVILDGRVAVNHPNEQYMLLMQELGPKGFKERA